MNGVDFNYSSLAKRIKLAKKILLYKEGFILHENSPSSDIMRWDLAVLFAKCMFALLSDNLKRGNKYDGESVYGLKSLQLVIKKAYFQNSKKTFIILY